MKMTLMTLEKEMANPIVIPQELESTFQIIYEGRVPNQWLKSIIT